jgi:hypothetical protein
MILKNHPKSPVQKFDLWRLPQKSSGKQTIFVRGGLPGRQTPAGEKK